MNNNIKQEDINNTAWEACDTFRGLVDPGQYKDYILVMLFLKYISDVWQDHYEEYQRQYGGDTARIHRKLKSERFVLPMVRLTSKDDETVLDKFSANYYELYERRTAPNIGELINIVLGSIEKSNKSKLKGVFRSVDFNSEANLGKAKDRNRRIKQLLEDFHKPQLDMRPSRISEDVIGNAYIYLIERFVSNSGKKAGEIYTPPKVTKLMAKLVMPKPGDWICDPACGSGGLLMQVAKEVGSHNVSLFGQESNGSTWALCRMNMFLHSFDSARVEWCDTLNSPMLVKNGKLLKFNCVVANPPFSLDKWGAENAATDKYNRFWRGVPPKSKGDWAFITHMVEVALEKEGRIVVVAPHGALFRGAIESRIRQKIVEDNLLDAVISLAPNLFPTTTIPVALLVFDRSREEGGPRNNCKDIFFIDASQEFVFGKGRNTLSEPNLKKIMEVYIARVDVEKFARRVTLDEIKENGFNLNISRYVDTYAEEEEIDVDAVQQEIDILGKELTTVQAKMAKQLKQIQR